MKRIFITIGLFVIGFTTNAQIPGYMGKKFSLIYSGGISVPHISIVTNKFTLHPSLNHAFKMEYITSLRSAVGLKYKLSMNSANNPTEYEIYNDFVTKHKFRSHSYGLYVKSYLGNQMAPLGSYFSFGFNFQQLIIKDIILEDYDTNIVTKETHQKFDLNLAISLGRNWIIADYLLIGLEAEFAPPFLSYISLANYGTSLSYNGRGQNINANRFNLASETLKISLNIGFLAF